VLSLLVFFAYFLWSKRARSTVAATEYLATVTLVAAVVVTPLALAGPGVGGMRTADWLWLVLFVGVAQGGHLLLVWAHPHIDVTLSSLLLLGEPPISAAAAFVVFAEPITWVGAIGGLVALGSLAAVVVGATVGENAMRVAGEAGAP
jgi:drug/metabolite transporter (DMT)-like permease